MKIAGLISEFTMPVFDGIFEEFRKVSKSEFKDQPSFIDTHRFNDFDVYTSCLDKQFAQHIFHTQKADKKFIKEFADSLPIEAAEVLYEAAEL